MRLALVGVVMMVGTSRAEPTLDDAMKQAAAANKPLVVEFSAQWCGPCKVFEKDVLSDATVQAALNDVVFVHYDAEVTPGLEAALKLGIEGFPTFVVVDKQGAIGAKAVGAMDVSAFLDFVHDAKNHLLDEAAIRAKVRAHANNPAILLEAARWFEGLRRRSYVRASSASSQPRSSFRARSGPASASCGSPSRNPSGSGASSALRRGAQRQDRP